MPRARAYIRSVLSSGDFLKLHFIILGLALYYSRIYSYVINYLLAKLPAKISSAEMFHCFIRKHLGGSSSGARVSSFHLGICSVSLRGNVVYCHFVKCSQVCQL